MEPLGYKLLWSSLGHSLPTPNIQLFPACWTLPPRHLNTPDLGSAAGAQISAGSSVSTSANLAVVFGTRRAPIQSFLLYRRGTFQCFATGNMARVCVSGGLFVGGSTG